MRRYVFSKDVIIVLIQMVSITHPLFDAVRKLADLFNKVKSFDMICDGV